MVRRSDSHWPRQRAFPGRLKEESGQAFVLAVLSLTVLLGFVAIATDVGMLLHAKRIMQTAADSAAIAAAAESGSSFAAQEDALQNGVPTSAVTVNAPPLNGPHTSKSGPNGYYEIILTQAQPTYFMGLFGKSSVNVKARAVATDVPSSTCVYTLGTTGTDISLTGSGSISIPSCGITDNSSSSSALNMVGSGSISALTIGIVGNYNKVGSGTISPTPTIGITAGANPLSSLSPPSYNAGSCNAGISYTGSGTHTVTGPSTPGGTICYDGFSNVGSGSVTFPSGIYVINGDFSNTGSGTISGTGVTFYMPSGSFSVTGSGTLDLSAPTSGPTNGILFYQNPNDANGMSIVGSSSSTLTGIFYLPGAQLSFTGSGGATYNTDLIVGSLSITGSATINNYDPNVGVSPLATPRLVE